MPAANEVAAALVIIGNEILSGRTQDVNLNWLATALNEVGVRLREVRVVLDDETEIIDAVNACRARYAYVFTTGGIGPTHDDITSACVAKAFGLPVERNPEAVRRLERQYQSGQLNAARLRMAELPQGCTLIDNPISNAPGFRIGNVFVLAGVPRIMQAMFESVRHELRGGAPMRSRTVVIHLPEGTLAAGLAALQAGWPGVELGSYPFFREGRIGSAIVARSTDDAALAAAAEAVCGLARSLGAEPLSGD